MRTKDETGYATRITLKDAEDRFDTLRRFEAIACRIRVLKRPERAAFQVMALEYLHGILLNAVGSLIDRLTTMEELLDMLDAGKVQEAIRRDTEND